MPGRTSGAHTGPGSPAPPAPRQACAAGVPRAGGAHAPRHAGPGRPVLGLDAGPQHVLPPGHVRMLPDEVLVVGQRELPAPADAHHGHVLQEVLHVLRAELRAAGVSRQPALPRPSTQDRGSLTFVTAATSFLTTHRLCVNFHI